MAAGRDISRRRVLAGSAGMAALLAAGPLAAAAGETARRTLKAPSGRSVSVTEWRPAGRSRGTILFSHGAGSAPAYYDVFVQPWVDAGWRVLAPLHVDSREHPDTGRYTGMASWKARIEDMRLLVDGLDGRSYVAAGHSYGGLVALAMGGARPVPPEGMALPLFARPARAVIAFSPPAPIPVLVTSEGYGALSVPALIQTGTRDIVPGITASDAEGWKGHLAPYEAATRGGNRYGLVLQGADHYFGGAICDFRQPGPRQLAQADLASRYAGLFLEAFGAGDATARQQLDARVTDALPACLLAK